MYFTDAAAGIDGWTKIAGLIILTFALVFLFVSSFCYEDLSTRMSQAGLKERFFRFIKFSLSMLIGSFVFWSCVDYQENKRIVHVCDQAFDKPNSKAYQAKECFRLRQQRQAVINQLEAKIRR